MKTMWYTILIISWLVENGRWGEKGHRRLYFEVETLLKMNHGSWKLTMVEYKSMDSLEIFYKLEISLISADKYFLTHEQTFF